MAFFSILVGCRKPAFEDLSAEVRFSLPYGKLEDQVDLFQVDGVPFDRKNRLFMRDGLFFFGNGSSQKIMEFSSYGDLILLLYDPERNPPPVTMRTGTAGDMSSTRRAVSYPFVNPGEIVVDGEQILYVEDRVAPEKRVVDEKSGTMMNRVVLRFDRRGEFQGFLGQEGPGGTPFPYIDSLFVTNNNDLVVVCHPAPRWVIYWFNREGEFLTQVEIDPEHLPPVSVEKGYASLEKVVPDRREKLLYLMVLEYEQVIDKATQTVSTIRRRSSRVYRFDLASGRYTGSLEVPEDERRRQPFGASSEEAQSSGYEFLGATEDPYFFFLRNTDSNLYQLLILDDSGGVRKRYTLAIDDSEISYRDLDLSPSGILVGVLGRRYAADVVWWRSDRLLRESRK